MTPILDRVFPLDQCCPREAARWDSWPTLAVEAYEVAARRQAETEREAS